MSDLFAQHPAPPDGPVPAAPEPAAPAATGPTMVVGVAVAAALWRDFDYAWPAGAEPPQIGLRVRVPFGKGNRKILGFVTRLAPTPAATGADAPRRSHALKVVADVLDDQPQLNEHLMKLAEWIGRYYLAPPGMVLSAMVPSAVGKHPEQVEAMVFLAAEPDAWPARLGPRQKRVLDELFEARKQGTEPLPLEKVLDHSEGSRATVNRLAERALVRIELRPRTLADLPDAVEPDPFDLNEDQRQVATALDPKLAGGFSVTVLHGVTGSGKTEVYLRAVRQIIAAGKQAIILVPEIALATQTLTRLARRLPRVAVLHSGLTGSQRAFYYHQIRAGEANAVIGPRSAIFAPFRRLGLIIVDEEHESSYKQDSVPRYHGRDVAVMRGNIEGVPVILGSATPSLESRYNAQRGRYALLSLPRRIRGLPMPKLELVELRKEITHGKVELIGRTLESRLAGALDRREQTILLMNRRGYASYVFCPSCRWQMECRQCSRAMVFHQAVQLAMCHYCQASSTLPTACPACGKKLTLFGLGIQRIESELARKFPHAVVARMDSDTMTTPAQFQEVFQRFASGDIDILLGTQMVAKGLDFPTVTLVGVVSADTSLEIPDFRAAERTFQLIVQVAGRAGRASSGGQVVVQTWHADDTSIQFALTHDYAGFAASELPLRQHAGLPPYVRIVRFLVRHQKVDKAETAAKGLAALLKLTFARDADVRLLGPAKAGIFRIRDQFRFQIEAYCPRPGYIQSRLAERMSELTGSLGAEVVIDADPMNML